MASGITIQGLNALQRKLSQAQFERAVSTGLKTAAVELKGRLAEYPPRIPGAVDFVSDRQRRYFFYALRAGIIEVPYRRGTSPGSERFGQSWTVKSRDWHTVVVGNDTSYGPYLMDPDEQSFFHFEGNWKTTDQVIDKHGDDVREAFAGAIRQWLKRRVT